jgi:hypothetical protein
LKKETSENSRKQILFRAKKKILGPGNFRAKKKDFRAEKKDFRAEGF